MRLIHHYSVASDNQKQIKYHKSRQNKHRRAWIDAELSTLFTAATMSLSPHHCVSDNNMMGAMMRSRRSRPDRSDHTCHNRRRRGLREAARFPQRARKRSAETSKVTIPNACAVGEGEQEAAALIPSLISVQNQLTQSSLYCSYGSVSVGSQAYSGLSTTTQLLHPLTRVTSARSRLCRDL